MSGNESERDWWLYIQKIEEERDKARAALREFAQELLRIPAKPFPDPQAHSWGAFAKAVHSAYCQMRFAAMRVLKDDSER